MPIVDGNGYVPEIWLRNGHVNTMYPYFFRKGSSPWQYRERKSTPDGDFFDVDWIQSGPKKKLLVLLHGLEGSSQSQYMKGFGHYFSTKGFHVAALHFRSCSGELNKTLTLYHSGFTEDLHVFLQGYQTEYAEIFLCGFSLGGSVCLNYMGRYNSGIQKNVVSAAAVSVPVDLYSSSEMLKKWENKLYTRRFLASLLRKINGKAAQFPGKIDVTPLPQIRNLWEFDELYTAPLHGFASAADYYTSCSAKPHLCQIVHPVLLVNALDDSFLPPACMPEKEAKENGALTLMMPKYGGHAGFATLKNKPYWIEQTVYRYFVKEC